MAFDTTTAIPIGKENADGLHEQGGQFDITTAQPISDVAPAISTPNPIPEKFSWQLAGKEAMAQIGDFFNGPSRFLGISKSQPQSKLATETLPAVGKFLTEPLGEFTIPTFSAENAKKLFKGDFNFDTIELSPSPLEVGINVAGAGIPAARQLSYNINRNMLLNNLINTEKVRGALIESMPAFDELIGSKLPKKAWADLSMEQKIAVIGQQAEKNPQVGQLVKGLSTGEIKPITAPETPATPQAGENVNFVNPEGIQKAGVIESVEGNRVAINLDGKTIIAPINQISPYIAPQSPEMPQNPLPQPAGKAISPEEALYAEARKYKSAEEFVKAQGGLPEIKLEPEAQEAVKNTLGAKLTSEGIELDISRFQKEEQFGEPSIRTGVFYLPEKKSPYQKYYSTGKYGYGGGEKVEGRTTIKNPIIVKAGTGGKGVEKAYDIIEGKGAYQKMRDDVLANAWGEGRRADENAIAGLLEKYGGNPDLAYDIVRVSKEGNTLPYAIQEHIAAAKIRNAGYDGVISYSKSGGVPRLSELFDVRATEYPTNEQDYSYKDFYEGKQTKSQLTDIWNKAQEKPTMPQKPLPHAQGEAISGEEALYAEARKYKSAEEFVKANTYYHQSQNIEGKFLQKGDKGYKKAGYSQAGEGIYFSPNKELVQSKYGKEGGKLVEANLDIKNPLDLGDKDAMYFDGRKVNYGDIVVENFKRYQQGKEPLPEPDIILQTITPKAKKWLIENGYDAVTGMKGEMWTAPEIVIFDKSQIKTTTQLTDIWNKAQEQPQELVGAYSESGQVNVGRMAELPKLAQEAVGEYIKKTSEVLPISHNIERDFNTLKTQAKADDLQARQLLQKINLAPADAEALYHYQENPQEQITPENKALFDNTIKPLADEAANLFAKLRNDGIPVQHEGYTPRYIADRGGLMDRIKSGAKSAGGKFGLLRTSSGSFKTRVMKSLTDEQGNRQVVSIKGGEVLAWNNNKSSYLGKFDLSKNKELLAEELAPIHKKVKALEKEEKLLFENKGRKESSLVRLRNIQDELMYLTQQEQEISWKYDPENFENKVFVDDKGKKWTVGEATTKEIEANTSLRYHKNALLNNLTHLNDLRKIDRATQYLEALKTNKDFLKFAQKIGTAMPPEGWKTTALPQFRGYYLEPHIADTMDFFNKQLYQRKDPLTVLTAVNRFLRTSIFFNPFIHTPNIAVHWAVNRGASKWVIPKEYVKLTKTGLRAIDAVIHQNQDYVDMLNSGVNLLYHEHAGDTLADLMHDKMGEEIQKSEFNKGVGQAIKNLNPYRISGKVTWASNDIATMQAIYEEVEDGKTLQQAIEDVGKHIPNYVMPSRIMGQRWISEVMTNPNITMFGAYHYGALKSYVEMAKDFVNKEVSGRNKLRTLDKIAMLGLIMYAIYPELDKFAQWVSGNKNAHFRRAGAATFFENLGKVADKKIDMAQFVQSVMTPAIGSKQVLELAFNRNLATGKKILHAGQEMGGLKDLALESISPAQAYKKIEEGKISLGDWLLSFGGISMSDPNVSKIYNLQDAKQSYQVKVDKMHETDPDKAEQMAEKFNQSQLKDLHKIVVESGFEDEVPQAFVNTICITSFAGEEEEPRKPKAKEVSELINKEKKPKRVPVENTPEF